jgi:PadR family transcriptional regulator AphA
MDGVGWHERAGSPALGRDTLARQIPTEHPRRHNRIDPTGLREPIAPAMRLKPSSYLILGMLDRGHQTGYAIKRTVDLSTRFFWAASLAQVYPELAALEQDGYVVSADEPHGNRPRKTYRLTDKGRAALADWLGSERVPDFEQRDEGLLRLFFADAIPLEQALELIKRLRARAEEIDAHFQADILPLAQRASGDFALIVAREGADYFAWRAGWFRQIEAEITSKLDARAD